MMKEKWNVYNKKADFKGIGERFGIDQVVARVVTNRDVVGDEALAKYFAPAEDFPEAEGELLGCREGAVLLLEKIRAKEKILVIGDYDADGVMSTVILMKAITALGGDVSYRIPHRILDGYGMNEEMVREALSSGVGCIVTCDNGISAMEPVRMAAAAGITVIITDHHAIPFQEKDGERVTLIPPADVIINPHLPGCPYPFKDICGALVALRFCQELFRVGELTPGSRDHLLTEFYDLAAVATATDVMPLVSENRRIVKRGVNKIPSSPNKGLRALCDLSLPGKCPLTGYDIGFIIGPCINAAGRVDTAARAVEFFLCEDEGKAAEYAKEMIALNEERKAMTKEGTEEGLRLAASMPDDKVLVICLPTLHESIAGLVAGKVRESTGKPAIVITDGKDGAKGSCRSVEGYSIIDELGRIRELFTHYGGHPLAAGFSLPKENIEALRRLLNEGCTLPMEELVPKVQIDVPMPLYYVNEHPGLIDDLLVLEPTGKGNERPVFAARDIAFTRAVRIGAKKNFLRLTAREDKKNYIMLLFREADRFFSYCREKFSDEDVERLMRGEENSIRLDVVYNPSINEYNGQRSVQFVIQRYR